jgi:hypothetical protein
MLKIDIDRAHRRSRFEIQRIMYSLPRPFFVRRSSGGTGLHLAVPAGEEWGWQRYAYDDPMRIDLDSQREQHRLPVRNLLWDIKNGKPAGQWRIIRTERDIENYIDASKPAVIYAHAAYNNICPNGQEKQHEPDFRIRESNRARCPPRKSRKGAPYETAADHRYPVGNFPARAGVTHGNT